MDAIAGVREFNRFYTKEIGLLERHMPASEFSLAEARVLFELAGGGEQTAAEIGRQLDMDKAHLSRILARFHARKLVAKRKNPEHGKQWLLSLTASGQEAYRVLDKGTRDQIAGLIEPLGSSDRGKLVAAMHTVKSLLADHPSPSEAPTLRSLEPGDIGWIVHRQALLYHREFGWDWTYEGLIAQILGSFIRDFDPEREDAWAAELGGRTVGSIFLVRGNEPETAKLRLLYVEPDARGHGIGASLVETCIERARALGYGKLVLWTNDVLASARKIYQAAGFELVAEEKHHSFGEDLVGQTWELRL
jgi:DNA-binding MarR family transcriptional regulator/GNAT superfamily N-acetyltransferase